MVKKINRHLFSQQEADRKAFEALPIEEQKKYIAIREESLRRDREYYFKNKKSVS